MADGTLDSQVGARICNGLGIMRACLETQKLEQLEARTVTDRYVIEAPAQLSHETGIVGFFFLEINQLGPLHSAPPWGEAGGAESEFSFSPSILQPNQSHGSRNPMVGLILGQAPTPAAQAICEGILVEIG
jgi:hypothetical protein